MLLRFNTLVQNPKSVSLVLLQGPKFQFFRSVLITSIDSHSCWWWRQGDERCTCRRYRRTSWRSGLHGNRAGYHREERHSFSRELREKKKNVVVNMITGHMREREREREKERERKRERERESVCKQWKTIIWINLRLIYSRVGIIKEGKRVRQRERVTEREREERESTPEDHFIELALTSFTDGCLLIIIATFSFHKYALSSFCKFSHILQDKTRCHGHCQLTIFFWYQITCQEESLY